MEKLLSNSVVLILGEFWQHHRFLEKGGNFPYIEREKIY